MLNQNQIQGYLAFDGDLSIGWCNAADIESYSGFVPAFAKENICGKTISIVCFEIAPEYRGKGIASAFIERVCNDAKEKGYVSTLWGRRRYLPELNSSNGMLRAFGERVARNMPIQGTAADIIKIAMVRVYNRLKEEKMDAKLILQVHDELIVEAPENEIDKAAKILQEEMENACQMKVRLRADVNTGKTWYDAKG